jgi:hypothetical protein
MENVEMLYDLCEYISEEIEDVNDKIKREGGKLTTGDLDVIDKLTHALKSIKTTIAMEEAEGHSYDDGMYEGRDGRSMRMMPRGVSYARDGRGRGTYAKRDSMGRYSSRGYSRAEGVKQMLEDAMESASTEREREAIRKAIQEMA